MGKTLQRAPLATLLLGTLLCSLVGGLSLVAVDSAAATSELAERSGDTLGKPQVGRSGSIRIEQGRVLVYRSRDLSHQNPEIWVEGPHGPFLRPEASVGLETRETGKAFVEELSTLELWDPVLDGGQIDEQHMQKIIQATYRTLEEYSAAADTPLHFELSELRTYLPHELDSVLYRELLSPAEGRLVDVYRQGMSRRIDGEVERGVSYRASWTDRRATDSEAQATREILDTRFGTLLQEAAESQPGLARTVAVTSYQVEVELGGESRSYRAAFVWLPTADGQEMTFFIADPVTQALDQVIREPLPAADERFEVEPESLTAALAPLAFGSCEVSWDQSRVWSPHLADPLATGHSSGNHYLEDSFTFTCSCDSDCRQTCSPQIASQTCGESGATGLYCHRPGGSGDLAADSVFDGSSSPAQCAAATGCAVKQCLGGCLFCGAPSVSVGVSKLGSVSFSVSPDSIWSQRHAQTWQCDPCTRSFGGGDGGDCEFAIDPEGCEGDDGGATGGGGGGGSEGGSSGGTSSETCVDVFDGETGGYLGECCGETTTEIVECAAGYL